MGKRIKSRCLIIDDEKYFSMYLKILFEHNGFEVTDCSNGKEALELLQRKSFEFIVSDIQMPVMDGFEFLEEMKNDEKINQIPVVILSNIDDCEYMKKAFKLGAAGYFKKPLLKHHLTDFLNLVGLN
jgi:YesN/AraC family two-component response regulator